MLQHFYPGLAGITMDHLRAYEYITNRAIINIEALTISQIEAAARLISIGRLAFTAAELAATEYLNTLGIPLVSPMDVDVAGMLFAINPAFTMAEFDAAQNLYPLMPTFTMDHLNAYKCLTDPMTLNIAAPTQSQIEAASAIIRASYPAFGLHHLSAQKRLLT